MIKIRTYDSPYQEEDVKKILYKHDKNLEIVDIGRIYYPYMRVLYNLTLDGKLGKIRKDINCIVDLAEGRLSMGQGYSNFVDLDVDEDALLERQISEEEAKRSTKDFAFKIFLNKTKLLMAPNFSVEEEEIFYKLFYIVKSKDKKGEDFYILVDSIEGKIIILDY